MASYLEQYGPALLGHGYAVTPIKPGSKAPLLRAWPGIEATPDILSGWIRDYPRAGVGVPTRYTPAVDIDVLDADITAKLLDWCNEHIGPTAARVGQRPKTLLVYRTDAPMSKMTSRTYEDCLGRRHHIEILGDGQQFVAYGTHPVTREPYHWVGAPSLHETPRSSLPTITEAQARDLIAYFASIIPDGWEIVEHGHAGQADDTPEDMRALRNAKPKIPATADQIREHLVRIDPDDYHRWVRVGMALYHQYDGDSEGLDLWDEWSQSSAKYKPGEIARKWRTFDANLTGPEPVTAATILHLGRAERDAGHDVLDEPVLNEFIERFVFCAADNGVIDLEAAPDEPPIPWNAFRNAKANVWRVVEDTAPSGKPRARRVFVANLWLEHKGRKEVRRTGYAPGQPRIYTEGGVDVYNTFHLPAHPETTKTDGLSVFFDHVDYLCPVEAEREWLIDWLARIVQYPGSRGMVTPLHISSGQGTGRGWLVKVTEALLGKWNCSATKMEALTGEGGAGNYQDYMHRTLFCSIGEVREGKKKFLVADMIRDRLTETRQGLNLKYGGYRTADVYTNFFFMSNHSDALILPPEDRRINVFVCPHGPKPGAYYEEINRWKDDPGAIAQLFHWLKRRDLSGFNWQTSMKNEARARMIENGQSETEQLFREMIAAPPYAAMTFPQIEKYLGAMSEDGAFGIDRGQLRKLLQNTARQEQRIKTGGRAVRPWVLMPDPLTAVALREAVAEAGERWGNG